MIKDIFNTILNRALQLVRRPRKLLIVVVGAFVIVAAAFFLVSGVVSDGPTTEKGVVIDRTYETVARTEEQLRTDGNFNLKITNAEFADYILVQGKRATPIEGKVFLVLNVEIENPLGGEQFEVGSVVDLRWKTNGSIDAVRLEYSHDDFQKDIIDLFIETTVKKELNLKKFETKLKHKIDLFLKPKINQLPKNLLHNVINGVKLMGYLDLK